MVDENPAGWRLIFSARPNFLILTPVCVFLGVAVAKLHAVELGTLELGLALLGALLAHASVNLLNEYEDFRTGLDFKTERTPFSGGSGTLQAAPSLAPSARVFGWLCAAGVAAIGVYFLAERGMALMPVGLAGLILVIAYSRWITHWPLVCLVTPGLGFGPVMVLGTEFALSGSFSAAGLVASLTPFFLVSNLLLLNQFPDRDPDEAFGRKHLPITLGRRRSAGIYVLFLIAAFIPPALALFWSALPALGAIGLIGVLGAIPAGWGAVHFANDIPRLVPFLGINVVVVLGTITLFAAGILVGAAS